MGQNPRTLGRHGFHRLLDETARRSGRGRQPGRGFGPEGEGYLRLAIVENEQRLRQAVREIGRWQKKDLKENRVAG